MDAVLTYIIKHYEATEEMFQLQRKTTLDKSISEYILNEYHKIDEILYSLLELGTKEDIIKKSKKIIKNQKLLEKLIRTLEIYHFEIQLE